ncbi:hypothetical protein XPA_001711 [Xanthoria parietina]
MSSKGTENLGSPEVFATGIIFGILSGLAVLCKAYTKTIVKTSLGWDDFWVLCALLFFWAEDILQLNMIMIARAGFPDMTTYLKVSYASVQFYVPAAVSVKLSLLCLYRRLFPVHGFHLASVIVMGLVSVWGITFFFVNVFMCNPPRKFWEPLTPGFCFKYGKPGLLVGLSAEIALDCTILLLPIKMISGLQMNKTKKVSLALIFLVGGFAVLTNVVRCIMSYDPVTGGTVPWQDMLWVNIHMGTSILCACLPTFRPLVLKANNFTSSLRQRYGSSNSKSKDSKQTPSYESSNSQNVSKRPEYIKMSDQDRLVRPLGPGSENTLAGDDSLTNNKGIRVERTVEVV